MQITLPFKSSRLQRVATTTCSHYHINSNPPNRLANSDAKLIHPAIRCIPCCLSKLPRASHRGQPQVLASRHLLMLVLVIQAQQATTTSYPVENFTWHLLPETTGAGASGGALQSHLSLHQIVRRNVILEKPSAASMTLPYGPGVDLVALNRRRFELEHSHGSSVPSPPDLHQAEFMEAQFALMPGRLMSMLPEPMSAQLSDTLNLEPEGMFSVGQGGPAAQGGGGGGGGGEVDDAGIERLTKGCMRVVASSAKPDQLNVTFLLFTRKNPQAAYVFPPQVSRHELLSPGSPFVARKPLKWITHGFKTNVDRSDWMTELKDQLLAQEDCNVILTDWRRGASPALAFYPRAAANTHVVAKMITSIIRRLSGDIDMSMVHLIGHSLGAHIMGFVGSAFTEESLYERQHLLAMNPGLMAGSRDMANVVGLMNKHLVGRITACDPALPCFGPTSSSVHQHEESKVNPRAPPKQAGSGEPTAGGGGGQPESSDWTPSLWTHLRPDSAALVEVIHTNPGMMGYLEPLGDYDFYPNGVGRQPGCTQSSSKQRRQVSFSQPAAVGSFVSSSAASALLRTSKFTSALGRIIKPIKDLVLGHTCSHHRSVEYLLDSMRNLERSSGEPNQPFCQMVGYRCDSYASFKKGYCFRCLNDLDCRTLGMPRSMLQDTLPLNNKFQLIPITLNAPFKRALPVMSHLPQIGLDQQPRNKYFYDTRAEKNFCAYHYHIQVKYRWFKVADSLELPGLELSGSMNNLTVSRELVLSRYGYSSFTVVLVESAFVGSIRSLVLFAEELRPELIEFVEVTYMSHLDAQIRARASGRLCWLPAPHPQFAEPQNGSAPQASLFVACSSALV